MAGEWREGKLGDVLSFANGRTSPERSDEGLFPVYGSNGIIGFAGQSNSNENTIIIGRVGSYCGSLHLSKRKCWITDNAIRANALGKNEPRFLFYLLTKLRLNQWRGGSGQPLLNQSTLSAIRSLIPPPKEQQAIACILGALDDKIELNRRMNQTLEAMARAIFKSWFVDFDPVRAKAASQQPPGLAPHIADLFPDSFEDSDLGELPRGWRISKVGDIATVSSGKRPTRRHKLPTEDARVPLWGGNGPMAYVESPIYTTPIILTGRVGTLGSVFRISSPCWPSDNTLVLQTNREIDFEFLYMLLRGVDFHSLNRGSTQPLLTQTDLKAQRFAMPSSGLLQRFHLISEPILRKSDIINYENILLAGLRDALLPKLISGKLAVPDIERIVGRCA